MRLDGRERPSCVKEVEVLYHVGESSPATEGVQPANPRCRSQAWIDGGGWR